MVGVSKFKKDPFAIPKITLMRQPFFVAILIACVAWRDPSWKSVALYAIPMLMISLNGTGLMLLGMILTMAVAVIDQGFQWMSFVYVAAAVLITFPISSLYHSATHMAFRPRYLNRVIGEALSFFHNVGIEIWSVSHYYHHLHSDKLGLDPHPNQGQKFWAFTKETGTTFPAAFKHHYFEVHKPTPRNMLAFKLTTSNFVIRNPLVTLIWFLMLGPTAFSFFFAANIVFKKFHYAWFNWATHHKFEGEVRTQNLNEGWYKFINAISWNLYFHENHHKYPNLVNPKKVPEKYLRAAQRDQSAA